MKRKRMLFNICKGAEISCYKAKVELTRSNNIEFLFFKEWKVI